MLFKLTPISLAIFLAAFVNLFVAYSSWQRRKSKGGVYFAYAMMAITFWTVCAGLDYAAVPVALKVFFAKLEYLGYCSAVALFTAFSLSYAGHEDWLKKPWGKLLLIGIPVSTILLAWTNELHGLIWTAFRPGEMADNVLIFEHGPAFAWVALSGYVLIVIIFVSLWTATRKGPELARKQARLLLGALLVLVASNLLYLLDLFNIPGVDWSSVAFSIVGLLFLYALYGSRFMDIVPVARNIMIERMADGVLVLDVQGRLVDFNPAAQTIFDLKQVDLWTPLPAALARWPEIIRLLANPIGPQTAEIPLGRPAKIYDLRLTPLEDNRHQMYGRLVVLRDITARKEGEAALRVSEERYQHFIAQSFEAISRTEFDEPIDVTLPVETQIDLIYENAYMAECNQALAEMYHLPSPQELIGARLIEAHAGKDNPINRAAFRKFIENGYRSSNDETIETSADGQPVWFLSNTVGTVENGQLVRLWGTALDITERKLSEEAVLKVAAFEERQRMARDLHDSVNQSIHSLVLFSETLTAMLDTQQYERAGQIAKRLQESARQALKETRLLLYQIRSPLVSSGVELLQNLEARLMTVERRAGMHAHLTHEGSLDNCPPAWAENLFWIIIEALNNSLKHAQAHTLDITLRCLPQSLDLEVVDDGRGFDPASVPAGGMGLSNMQHRASLIGGKLEIVSAPQHGCRVHVHAENTDQP